MGLKLFERSKKSDFQLKIDRILDKELFDAHTEVLKAKLSIQNDKKSKNIQVNTEYFKQVTAKYDEVTKHLLNELAPLKTKNATNYQNIEKQIKDFREEITDLNIKADLASAKKIFAICGAIRTNIQGM